MSEWLIAVLIGLACGAVVGVKIARDSNAKLAIKGGSQAQVFHYLASASLTSVLPTILTGLILGLGFVVLLGTGLTLIALTGLFLLAHAWFEHAASTPAAAR